MSHQTATPSLYLIGDIDQIAAFESGVRVEIADVVTALGPCSIAEAAQQLGRSNHSLYHHFRVLVQAGLLSVVDSRQVRGQEEALYAAPGRSMALQYDADDPENVAAISRVVASISRVAVRDFRRGFRPDLAVVSGPQRNLWVGRTSGWLSEGELKRVNRHLTAAMKVLAHTRSSEGRRLHSLSWFLAPVPDLS